MTRTKMSKTLRAGVALCGCLMALFIAGCRHDSGVPADDAIQVETSAGGVVMTGLGQSRGVGITFLPNGKSELQQLTVDDGLEHLPAGWNGPSTFGCARVTSSGNCVLNLSYTPTTVEQGVLSLSYRYRVGMTQIGTGTISIDYRGTVTNSVAAIVAPGTDIKALVGGGNQTVAVTFNTDDGNPASALAVTTDLTALPAGWSSTSNDFSCSEVSTGNGCQLLLSYAPTSVGSGTLVLNYSYDDNSGVAKVGSVGIDYAGTSHNNLIGTAAPSGQVNATVGASARNVTVTFTTDDGHPASNIALTTNLASLPAGWASTTPSFSCTNASIGNGCQLLLTYTPPAVDSGTLTLQYTFDDNSGAAHSGSLDIPYIATSNNSVVGTASPSGQITVAAGASQQVTLTFTTDDGYPASALSVTSDLTALPAGWSSASPTFNCASVSSGSGCQLEMTYAPTSGASGTLSLNYAYTNHAGAARTGSVLIPYQATSLHVYTGELVGAMNYCAINADGTLSNCAPTSGLAETPAIAFKGNRAYIAEFYLNTVNVCSVAADGSLSGCVNSGGIFTYPFVLTIGGDYLYAGSGSLTPVTYCRIENDGSLSNCATTTSLGGVEGLAVANGYAYVSQPHQHTVNVCEQNSDGSLSNCAATGSGFSQPEDLAIADGYAYVTNTANNTVSTCLVSVVDGTLSSCTTSPVPDQPMGIALNGTHAYISTRNTGIYVCNISGTGALSNCASSNGGASFGLLVQIAVH